MDKDSLLDVLKSEMERSTGCTDPGGVALAVSRATLELGQIPETVEILVSPNVFKNAVGVGIPGTGRRGLPIAVALGAVIERRDAGLAIFDYVTPDALARAETFVEEGRVRISYGEATDPLYISARVFSKNGSARVVIANDYSNIVEVSRNDTVIFSAPLIKSSAVRDALAGRSLESLFGLVAAMEAEELDFLLEVADINLDAAKAGLADPSLKLGRFLEMEMEHAALPQPLAAMHRAQVLTAAASEARMAGLPVAIMAIAGSGNHGITFSLGLMAVAETLGLSRAKLARALAYGALVTVVIKSHVHRMTAFCGCAVAASTGVAAGTVFLLGGDFAVAERAMQSVIGTLAGMLCDGAKESCSYKLSTSVSLAIQSAFGAMAGASIPAGMGIVGATIEDSFANLGLLNDPGMVETGKLVLQLIQKTGGTAQYRRVPHPAVPIAD